MSATDVNRESAQLAALAGRPALARVPTYLRLSGPGWLQGAMTLGGGSAITSLTIGAVYGYELLWVQPLAMIIGCIMLFALSHQTLSTGIKPFTAMRRHAHPALAWLWAIAALASSIIWGFSHYPLSAGMLEEVIAVGTGFSLKESGGAARELFLFALALAVWMLCARTAWYYGAGGRAVKVFETAIKFLSGMIILAFLWVVVSATAQQQVDWPAVLAGYVPGGLPADTAGVTTVMAALGTAVGINMTFVYGYTLLDRGWGSEQRELSRYDILMSLVIPYVLVVGLISIEIFGYRDPAARQYAVDLGLAMQLTNIMRDIREDADRDRIYIPQDEMESFGYREADLKAGVTDERFRGLMRVQAKRARGFFDSGARLFDLLSPESRACPEVLHALYSTILDRIESSGFDVFNRRIGLSTPEKLLLIGRLWTKSVARSLVPHGR